MAKSTKCAPANRVIAIAIAEYGKLCLWKFYEGSGYYILLYCTVKRVGHIDL